MSTSTGVTRSKGESDRLSLPMMTRPTRRETISGQNRGTALNTTFNVGWDQQQQMPTQMPQLLTPDGSDRHIHQIDNKVFHAGYLENGNNAYLLELPALEKMLNTWKFLMDEMSGQFYTVYGNSYQRMSTKPMLKQVWTTGELIDQLAMTRQAFGYAGLARSTPPLATGTQSTASTSRQLDDLLLKQPAPKTVHYQPPSFKLTRPMARLTMNERIQVHHNYISAVSSLEHKIDLINRLK